MPILHLYIYVCSLKHCTCPSWTWWCFHQLKFVNKIVFFLYCFILCSKRQTCVEKNYTNNTVSVLEELFHGIVWQFYMQKQTKVHFKVLDDSILWLSVLPKAEKKNNDISSSLFYFNFQVSHLNATYWQLYSEVTA